MSAQPELIAAREVPGTLDVIARPLDWMRRRSWALSARTAFGRACLKDRGLRLTTLALGHMLVAAALTLLAPVWLLLLGPLVLGVPHVASDVRYLLLNPPLPLGKKGLVLLLGPLAALTGLRIVAAAGGPYLAELEIGLGAAALLGGVAAARATWRKKALFGLTVLGLAAAALASAYDALVVVAHLHNLVAFGLWLWLFRAESPARGLLILAASYLAVVALFMSGVADDLLMGHALASDIGRFGMVEMAETLAPGFGMELGLRVVAVYCFAQAIHYVVWLRLIPQRLDARTAPPTVKRSVQRLRGDFGQAGFALLVLATLAIPLMALAFDATQVRNLYLLAAIAHGWLELAIIAALLTRARRPRGAG